MEIYSEMYGKPFQADSMILPLSIVHFDTAVLFGVTGAILFLQEPLGVDVDGIFGSQTESGLRANNNKETALILSMEELLTIAGELWKTLPRKSFWRVG